MGALATISLLGWGVASADEVSADVSERARNNSINASPLGILAGGYNLNYERLFEGGHGLLVEAGFASSGNDNSSASSLGGSVGYRWHWRGRQNSGFLGVNVGYGIGSGEASVTIGDTTESFDVDTTALTVTGNVGKRWAWDWGLNITLRVGAGYGNYGVSTDDPDPNAQQAVDLVDDLLTLLPVAIDGELSIGYTF